MSNDLNAVVRILNAEAKEQLKALCNKELRNVMKLRFLYQESKALRFKTNHTDGDEPIQRALKVLSIYAFLNQGERKDDCLIDLGNLRNSVNLSYTERKALRQQLTDQLNKNLSPLVEYYKRISKELAESQTKAASGTTNQQTAAAASVGDNQLTPECQQLLQLENQRRAIFIKRLQQLNLKCSYMKTAAEMKTGPSLAHELQLLESQARIQQIKANLLRGYFVNEMVNRTEYSVKAIKEVEGYINAEIEKLEE